jgi:prepilin-type N-terminal cleavage/methylation domain-containing protein
VAVKRTRFSADERQVRAVRTSEGFTLIEMVTVVIIVGILLGITIPLALGYRDRGWDASARENLRAAVPAIEAYHDDHNGYTGMALPALQAITPGVREVVVVSAGPTTYCLRSTVGTKTWFKGGPRAAISASSCA